ncbi:MAG: excinuclease ABC subunit UvrC [Deltaproteobacteria bacterium]|nr:excinuclease ABC subunit UvrC [Deltaproteobacteria bacterium]
MTRQRSAVCEVLQDMLIRDKAKDLPVKSGVYLMKDKEGKVLYIGKAKNIRARVGSYFRETSDNRYIVKFLISKAADIEYIVTANEKEAIILEDNLLKKYKPRYNIRLKDDKTYASIKITVQDKFPRIIVTRQIKKDSSRSPLNACGDKYFGPYTSASKVRVTLRLLRKIFPIRTCSDAVMSSRKRPCIDYQIKRCLAPCTGIAAEKDYRNAVNGIVMFLEGRNKELIESLRRQMKEASIRCEFERAAVLRDQIMAVLATLEKQRAALNRPIDADTFGVARKDRDILIGVFNVREGRVYNSSEYIFKDTVLPVDEVVSSFITQYYSMDRYIPDRIILSTAPTESQSIRDWLEDKKGKKIKIIVPKKGDNLNLLKMAETNAIESLDKRQRAEVIAEESVLKTIKDRFRLKNIPERIEAFDISNLSGKLAVGAMVSFKKGKACKEDYRLFRIRCMDEPNDYAMMEEVLSRRYKKDEVKLPLPNLIVMDGGKGQLNICKNVLDKLGLKDIDCIALAKDREKTAAEKAYLPNAKDPVILKQGSSTTLFLRMIRDEVHRFAIKYHKKLRKKQIGSILETIRGIGKKKAKDLLLYFGSIDRIRTAAVEEIIKINGITGQLAEEIKKKLAETDPIWFSKSGFETDEK